MNDADLVVIGAGPAGVEAARTASLMGARVILVDHSPVGGTCLHRGCIPTVASMEIRRRYLASISSQTWGIPAQVKDLDWEQMRGARDTMVNHLHQGTAHLLEQLNVTYLSGTAELTMQPTPVISVVGSPSQQIKTASVVVATGAPFTLPSIPGIDSPQVWTSDHALGAQEAPKHLIVYGGSFIGVEWAQFFHALGSQVTLLETGTQLLPGEDQDIAEALAFLLTESGIEVRTLCEMDSLESSSPFIDAVSSKTRIRAHRFLVADCRRPRPQSSLPWALESTGGVMTDRSQRTSIKDVYAAGDITGGRMLSHWARAQGRVAALTALGEEARFDPHSCPRVYHCDPEVAAVGMTTQEAQNRGYDVIEGQADLGFNARSVIAGQAQGMIKIVASKPTGRILGVHILAPMASEVIAEATLALRLEALAEDLAAIVHGHPTVAEALSEAAQEVVRQL